MPRLSRLVALGAAAAAYSFYEPYRYRLETRTLSLARPIERFTILHLSDTHMSAADARLERFLADIPSRLPVVPDLIVATGDFIEGNDGIDRFLNAVEHYDATLGRFYVLGSHDYYEATAASYAKYFTGRSEPTSAKRADSDRLERGLRDAGWIPLTNRSEHVKTSTGMIRLSGVDDPYLQRHRTEHIRRDKDDALAIAAVHAPDVVSEWALNDFDVVLAGHTHGGQVRIPGLGAVVTNCSLPTGLAAGANRVGSTWLHVSRGLGTGRFSPVRFACAPEITLLTLTGNGAD